MLAYVQISLDESKEEEIFDQLSDMHEVKEVHILFGEWDMMIKIELDTAEGLGSFVMTNIRNIPGIRLTSTMIVAK